MDQIFLLMLQSAGRQRERNARVDRVYDVNLYKANKIVQPGVDRLMLCSQSGMLLLPVSCYVRCIDAKYMFVPTVRKDHLMETVGQCRRKYFQIWKCPAFIGPVYPHHFPDWYTKSNFVSSPITFQLVWIKIVVKRIGLRHGKSLPSTEQYSFRKCSPRVRQCQPIF